MAPPQGHHKGATAGVPAFGGGPLFPDPFGCESLHGVQDVTVTPWGGLA